MTRRSALGMVGGAAAGVALAGPAAASAVDAVASPASGSAPVELVDQGATVVLRNGLVSVTVEKATARIPEIRLIGSRLGNEGVNLVSGARGNGYTTYDYHVGITRFSRGLSGGTYRVVAQSDERVEIAIGTGDPAVLPFTVDIHFVLERGRPGLYSYQVFGYPEGMPAGLTIQQLRYAFAADDPAFTFFVVDDERGVQQRPSIEEMAAAVTVQDTTYVLPDGRMYSKYQNISDLEGDSAVFMISNGRLGMALVQGGKEAFAGGPTKQELTCHDYFSGEILLWHPFTSHYGSPDLEPPRGWSKIFGPFYLHVNEAAAGDGAVSAMWTDAKRAAAREKAQWPYRWVSDPLYAADSRSTVSGRLTVNGREASGWVVLSPPGPDRAYQGITLDGDDWQYQNLDYVYSARIGHGGRFAVRGVRPGSYTLSAFTRGVFGEFKRHGVTVRASRHVELGHLAWTPQRRDITLWQIGTPDRSADEFQVFGGRELGFRLNMTWLEYPYEYPDGVDFEVGADDPRQDWNYFQPCYRTPGTDLQLQLRGTAPDRSLTEWRVRFRSNGYRGGTATLDIALAAAVFGTLRVALNGTELVSLDPLPGPAGDNSSYRLACRGMYRRLAPITFPARLIRPGSNVLTFAPVRAPQAPLTRAGAVDNWMEPMAGVMYDAIRLSVAKGSTA